MLLIWSKSFLTTWCLIMTEYFPSFTNHTRFIYLFLNSLNLGEDLTQAGTERSTQSFSPDLLHLTDR